MAKVLFSGLTEGNYQTALALGLVATKSCLEKGNSLENDIDRNNLDSYMGNTAACLFFTFLTHIVSLLFSVSDFS